MDLQSAYDDYYVNDVNTIKIDSKYGDFDLKTVDNIAVSSAYTDFKIKNIETSGLFKTNYGDVRIDDVKTGFNGLDIVGNYTDFTIGMDPSVSYQLDVKTSYGDMNKPATLRASSSQPRSRR